MNYVNVSLVLALIPLSFAVILLSFFLKPTLKTIWTILVNLPKLLWHFLLAVFAAGFYGVLIGILWVTTKIEKHLEKKVKGA